MKKVIFIIPVIIVFAVLLIPGSCDKTGDGRAPAAITLPATQITKNLATLNGEVDPNFLPTIATFEYGTSVSYGQEITAYMNPITGGDPMNVTADLKGLTAGVTYHFRAKAVNDLGTIYGSDMVFTTAYQPEVSTAGLLGEWFFEDNLNDNKPNGSHFNLNIVQGSVSFRTGKVGKALYLEGGTKINNTRQDLVTFINEKNPWTICFWFRYKAGLVPIIQGAKHLISVDQQEHADPYKRIWIQAADFLYCESENFNFGDPITLTSKNRIDDDKWYFATITQDGSITRVFVDNIIQDEKPSVNLGTDPLEAFVVGSCSDTDWQTEDFYDGYLDQLRVYTRVLTLIEMDILYKEAE